MAAARRPPPIYVLNHDLLVGNGYAGKGGEGCAEPNVRVGNGNLTGKAGEGWAEIEITRRKAYGCGDNMREALDGLSLCVRLGDDPLVTSELGLRVSRDARERFSSELGLDALDDEVEMTAIARILMQEQGLLIILLLLERDFRGLSYVYDHSDASVSMVSWLPDSLVLIGMPSPVPKRTSDGAYELFLLACDAREDGRRLPLSSDTDPPSFLCVFSPATGAAASPTCAWETKRRTVRNWNVPLSVQRRLRTHAAFCFQDKGFWADLSQALVYCDLHAAGDDSAVDFGCIELPGECQLTLEEMLDCGLPMKVTPTIGCVGDSIWFVCIHRGQRHADDSVTMWTLELPGRKWKEARFPVRELWRFDGFREFLGFSYSDVSYVDHICIFDVRNKRLLWHGSVHDHICTQTVASPPEFLPMKHGSHKRKFDELHPAAGPDFAAKDKE